MQIHVAIIEKLSQYGAIFTSFIMSTHTQVGNVKHTTPMLHIAVFSVQFSQSVSLFVM